jgi:hypothetical protein
MSIDPMLSNERQGSFVREATNEEAVPLLGSEADLTRKSPIAKVP